MRPHRRQPTRLPRPWDSPGKNTGVGCHFLLQCMKVKSESEVAQSCQTLPDPMDCSLPGSSVHGIFQARVLEWGAIAFSLVYYSNTKNTIYCSSEIQISDELDSTGHFIFLFTKPDTPLTLYPLPHFSSAAQPIEICFLPLPIYGSCSP